MPVATTLAFVRDLLNNQNLPGSGQRLEAFVKAPDPDEKMRNPHAYVWLARGNTRRVSGPRSAPPPNLVQMSPQGPRGWKKMTHNVGVYLTWFDDNYDPSGDSAFPIVLDWVMMMLETCKMPQSITDPATGDISAQLINLGQNMDYEYVTPRSTASQRMERQDALITCPCDEWVQR